MRTSKSSVAVSFFGVLFCAPISAQVTQRVSVDSAGVQGSGHSATTGVGPGMSISADGRYVAFDSDATNLVPGDTNNASDVFVHDRATGTTERVSLTPRGWPASGDSFFPSISADGRFVAFTSVAPDLVPGDTNSTTDIFVRDRQSGTTERVSVATGGAQNHGEGVASISGDGRFVAFKSWSPFLVPNDTNGWADIFLRDRQSGTTVRVSVTSAGAQGNQSSDSPSISADGRFVAFESRARLALQDSNSWFDIYVHDCQTGTTEFVSMSSAGAPASTQCSDPSISADGRYVAFWSSAHNLIVPPDNDGEIDTFLRDRQAGTTELVSLSTAGVNANGTADWPSISADGRYVAFTSNATNLVPGDTNGAWDVFLRDRQNLTTERVSLGAGGAQGTGDSGFVSPPSVSADGRYVAFDGDAANLVSGDTNGFRDIFVRDRDATGFTSLCDPGVSGVVGCPCSNPASGSGRGCDNSATTGGASLSAAGVAYFSMESLVFTTSGEKPTALSILLQGNAVLPNGVIYGQGVRCAGGALKRLFVKTAVAGSITAPDFGAGDPTLSARSAAKGDVIQPGQSRWYLVYYRDPTVLGGCPAGSTFNATQTGQVTWWP